MEIRCLQRRMRIMMKNPNLIANPQLITQYLTVIPWNTPPHLKIQRPARMLERSRVLKPTRMDRHPTLTLHKNQILTGRVPTLKTIHLKMFQIIQKRTLKSRVIVNRGIPLVCWIRDKYCHYSML